MTKALPHAWTWGAGHHPTRDAECSCGIEMHDVGGKGPRKVEYRDLAGRVFATIPSCTRDDTTPEMEAV